MNKAHLDLIRQRYENAVSEYCVAFCQKHGYYYDPDGWVRNNIGGVLAVGDYFIDFSNIRLDIDNDVPEEKFVEWYDYSLEIAMIDCGKGDMHNVNYEHYLMGARPYSKEDLEKIREAHERVVSAEKALKDCLAAQTDEIDFIKGGDVCGECPCGVLQPDGNYCRCRKDGTFHKYNDSACRKDKKGGKK